MAAAAVEPRLSQLPPSQAVVAGSINPTTALFNAKVAKGGSPTQGMPIGKLRIGPNGVIQIVIPKGVTVLPRTPNKAAHTASAEHQGSPVALNRIYSHSAPASAAAPADGSPRPAHSSSPPSPAPAAPKTPQTPQTTPPSKLAKSPPAGPVKQVERHLVIDSIVPISVTINAKVFKAQRVEHTANGPVLKDVILKVNFAAHSNEAKNIKRLKQAQVPHIIDILDIFKGDLLKHPAFKATDQVLVLPNAGEELYTVAKNADIKMSGVLKISKQLLENLAATAAAKMNHGDYTSKNIVVDPITLELKVIDWESACAVEDMGQQLPALWWRAPEYFTKHELSHPDMFSLGCVLFQLVTKRTLMASDWKPLEKDPAAIDSLHMQWIVSRLGMPPASHLAKCENAELFFDEAKGVWTFKSPLLAQAAPWKQAVTIGLKERGATEAQATQFLAFMEKLLCYEGRLSAAEALKLPLFS